MRLNNTTSSQDRVLEPLEGLLSLDTVAIMSVIEDLDQKLSDANARVADLESDAHGAAALEQRLDEAVAELERLGAEHAELMLQHEKLQRHTAVLEAELSDNAERSSDSQKNN